jgi:hypothetical protein
MASNRSWNRKQISLLKNWHCVGPLVSKGSFLYFLNFSNYFSRFENVRGERKSQV